MCKFNNYLFIFIFVVFSCWTIALIDCKPLQMSNGLGQQLKEGTKELNDLLALSLLAATMPKDDYNLHYDQRQKGNENYRLKLDGFFIGLPQEDDSALLLLTEELLENLGNNDSKPEMDYNFSTSSLSLLSPSSTSSSSLSPSSSSSSLSPSSSSSLSPSSSSSSLMYSKPEILLAEMPSMPKQFSQHHDPEGRNNFITSYGNADNFLRPKSYLYRLLNMLKQHSP